MERFEKEKFEVDEYNHEELVNTLDPEMDLRNINFATGENRYLTEHNEDDSI